MTQLRADVTRFLNDRLDWNLLRTFLVIMQERSVSRAAARLHLTQPAVSQALKRLEDTLGRNLIQRRGPHFEPTRAGEEVYRIASDSQIPPAKPVAWFCEPLKGANEPGAA
ncbi:HTH-type transcriptional regulator ArgP [Paraburkholderia aspalathi]|uniref:HTH-type transcriptional regulator ArgP n=1 Tax=Paraburkholderia aspalathi TaxID=1324617 RepID=A0ABN7N896_9BURK|nr:HTH-type transcriptional regulator ArgP [Paraburkholderia aspalathi]